VGQLAHQSNILAHQLNWWDDNCPTSRGPHFAIIKNSIYGNILCRRGGGTTTEGGPPSLVPPAKSP